MRIIIYDKNEDLLKSFKTFLELSGHDVISTNEYRTAISLAHSFETDILISEYIPEDNEFLKLFELIQRNKPYTKIIILSNFDYTEKELESLLDLEITSVFKKPIDPELLDTVINKFKRRLVELKIKL